MNDAELIEQYHRGSTQAFTELVQRHANWVYSAAQRRVWDAHLAEDITQKTFMALWRQPPRNCSGSVSPWLFGVLDKNCKAAIRSRTTQRHHESKAAMMKHETSAQLESDMWEQISPHLDEIVGRLRARDREIVLLRFYEQQSFAQVGAAIGVSEEAARKRVSRALERLRQMFYARGLNTSSVTLSAALLSRAATPKPQEIVRLVHAFQTLAESKSAAVSVGSSIAKGAIMAKTISGSSLVVVACFISLFAVGIGTWVWWRSGGATAAQVPASVTKSVSSANPPTAATKPPLDDLKRDEGGWTEAEHASARQVKALNMLIMNYARNHNGFLPPDLGVLAPDVKSASVFINPRDPKAPAPPETVTPAWVNQNSSYVYLGGKGMVLHEFDEPQPVLIHERLDIGQVANFVVGVCPDARAELVASDKIHERIADSIRVLSQTVRTIPN